MIWLKLIKKFLPFAFALSVFLCTCMLAAAEALPEVVISCHPETLIGPAEITLSFSVTNNTGNDCANFYIFTSDGLESEPLGSLLSGESISFTRRHSVTEQELGAEKISYTFSYDDPAAPERKVNFTAETRICKSESRTDCEFTRRFSSDTVPSGGTLTILYTVRNTGNVPVEGIRVTDTLGDFTVSVNTLEAGESRSFAGRVTLTEPAVSVAKLVYDAEDGSHTVEPENVEIGIANGSIDISFTAAPDPNDPNNAIGTLTLTNTGDIDYSKILVTDDFTDAVVAEGLTLSPGAARTITHTFPYRGESAVRWRVMASASDGTDIDLITDTIQLPKFTPDDLTNVSFTAEALTPKLRKKGNAIVRLTVANNGDAAIGDIVITEASTGPVLEMSLLAAGMTVSRDIAVPIGDDSDLVFSISYTDADGWDNTTDDASVSIRIAPDGIMPEGAKSSLFDFSASSLKIGGSSLFALFLIVGFSLLIILTIVLIVLSHRARVQKYARKERRKQSKWRS